MAMATNLNGMLIALELSSRFVLVVAQDDRQMRKGRAEFVAASRFFSLVLNNLVESIAFLESELHKSWSIDILPKYT